MASNASQDFPSVAALIRLRVLAEDARRRADRPIQSECLWLMNRKIRKMGRRKRRRVDPMEQIAGFGGSSVLRAIDALHKQQRHIASIVDSPAVKALQDHQRRMASLVDSPAVKAMQDQQRHIASIVDSPAVKALQDHQRHIASIVDSPAMQVIQEQQRRMASLVDSPAMKALQDQQRRIASIADSPALKALQDHQRHIASIVDSPAMKAIQQQQQRMASIVGSPVLDAFRGGLVRVYERSIGWLDHHWADLETENADHPHPVLFLVASFSWPLAYRFTNRQRCATMTPRCLRHWSRCLLTPSSLTLQRRRYDQLPS